MIWIYIWKQRVVVDGKQPFIIDVGSRYHKAQYDAISYFYFTLTNLVLIVQAASHQVQPTVQHVKAGKTHFFFLFFLGRKNFIQKKIIQKSTELILYT